MIFAIGLLTFVFADGDAQGTVIQIDIENQYNINITMQLTSLNGASNSTVQTFVLSSGVTGNDKVYDKTYAQMLTAFANSSKVYLQYSTLSGGNAITRAMIKN